MKKIELNLTPSMPVIPVVLDACVIFPMPLCDTLLRAAEANLYRVHFSQEILDGATRNLVNKGKITEAKAVRFQAILKTHFPEAIVEVPEELVAVMTNHPGDRHVVAAAIIAKADIIVTTNLKHFPTESLAPFGIKAQHPDIFLKQMYELFPDSIIQVIEQQPQDLKNPPLNVTELLDKLGKQVPEFVSKVWLTIQNLED
ncbi:MAG: PIN domain-containing protein [Gloeocapsa sp. UFS-A4-WI-NPMV-4B04]|jgi:predicted nucleic acid-binding protein|nr:PIN domain-containing protein [Gloeocapsa sp. UFS-A4-WI-NPMV-4B04]